MLRTYKKFWRRYFDFKGRSRRSDYWWVFLINIIIYLVLATIFLLSSGLSVALNADVDNFSALTWIALILLIVWGLTSIIPLSALAMLRIRDTGLSPFLWLVFPASLILGEFTQIWAMIISTVLAIVYLIFTLLPSKPDKIKPDSQIKGSLIVTTGLLILIIFSVGHLPAKAEQIVYGNPAQPVVNGQASQSFISRFDDAVTLNENNQYVVDKVKLPKNATQTELDSLRDWVAQANVQLKQLVSSTPSSEISKKDDVVTVTTVETYTKTTSYQESDKSNVSMLNYKVNLSQENFEPVQYLAGKTKYHEGVNKYKLYWWGDETYVSKSTANNILKAGSLVISIAGIFITKGKLAKVLGTAGVLGTAYASVPGGFEYTEYFWNVKKPITFRWQ